jgi:hypothetical protein
MVSEVLIPRPYGIFGMIGDMIRAVEIALLKESLGVIMSEGSRAISKASLRPGWRIRYGPVGSRIIRKRPGLSWDYIAERVAKQGGELHLLEIRWEMPLPARHACFFSKPYMSPALRDSQPGLGAPG